MRSAEQKNFNSIKVQLELVGELCMPSYHEFQFHKGTIRTLHSVGSADGFLLFQFHKGTIRTVYQGNQYQH